MSEAQAAAVSGIKSICSKLTWKHGLILATSIGLVLYPQPLIKLFLPIVSKFSKNHAEVVCQSEVKEIILTTNQQINIQNIQRIKIVKGISPRTEEFREQQREVIDWMPKKRKRSNICTSHTSDIISSGEDNSMLYGETLWNSFRLAKLEHKQLRLVLIKCSEAVLHVFLLRFYNFTQNQLHKLGAIPPNKLVILRLNQRVGTYQHLTCEFEDTDLL